MSRVRVYELANQLGIEAGLVAERARAIGINADGHLSQLDEDQAAAVKKAFRENPAAGQVTQKSVARGVIRRRRRADRRPRGVEEAVAVAVPEPVAAPVLEVAAATVVDGAAPAASEAPTPDGGAPAPVRAKASEEPKVAKATEEPSGAPRAESQPSEAPVLSDAETPPAQAPAAGAPTPGSEPAGTTAAPVKEEPLTRTDTKYGGHRAANRDPQQVAKVAPVPTAFATVVGKLDEDLARNLRATEQARRAERGTPRPSGPPGRVATPGPGPNPFPGNLPGGPGKGPAGRDTRRRRPSRVAYDRKHDNRHNDKRRRGGKRKQKRLGGASTEITVPKASKRVVKMEETITVAELSSQLSVKTNQVIGLLMNMGEMVTVNHVLDLDTVGLVAQEFGFTVENVAFDIANYIPEDPEAAKVVPRDAVVTVMGHVDHGKTSLLDYIRKARVAAGEAGGITQHIGAYKVGVKLADGKRSLVFLDTPGHAAFTAMRARGAQVTDIVILIVSADDGPMPQTVEAINHSKAAGVPIVVAVNKVDKPDANPEKTRQQLTEHGIIPEDWGGEQQFVDVSAKTGQGIPELLEAVALQADLLELTAVADRPAKGVVLEAELSKGRGPVATVLVQDGNLKRGDIVVAGKATGRVRALIDDKGRQVKLAGPATPVEVLGLGAVPPPSEMFFVVKDERHARTIVSHLEDKDREKRLAEERKKVSLDDLFAQVEAGQIAQLNLIIKSDVQGSLEAMRTAFGKLKHSEVEVNVIHSAVGAISESDVGLASASNAVIIGFNVRPEKNAKAMAEQEGIDVQLFSVIYEAVDAVKLAMQGLLSPTIEERFLGKAAIRETFTIPRQGTIAGCAVLQGKLVRNQSARLVRDGIVVYTGKIDSLRRFKENVAEVDRGHECGAHLERYNDVKIGDEIECFELVEVAPKLELEEEI